MTLDPHPRHEAHAVSEGLSGPAAGGDRSPRRQREAAAPVRCLLTTLHPERGLSRALVQHLVHEMPQIEFTLDARHSFDAVWVCGYERGAAKLVRRIRERHRHALLVVTGRGPVPQWGPEVLSAGADEACSWPIPYRRLSRILHAATRSDR